MGRVRPANVAGFISVVALALAALYGDQLPDRCSCWSRRIPLTFFLTLARPRREHASWAMAVVLFGTLWIGMAMAHAVLLRELPHGGSLVVAVLLGTFLGDTAAYFGGRSVRPHPARAGALAEQDARGARVRRRGRHARLLALRRSATTTGSPARMRS